MIQPVTTDSRHLTASMVVIDPGPGVVLLIHHRASNLWMFPGGHVDPDETPGEAALREVFEETGVIAHHVRPAGHQVRLPLWMTPHPSPMVTAEIPAPAKPDRPGRPAEPMHHHIDLLYVGRADSRLALTAAVTEVEAARWVPLSDLGGLRVRDEVPAVARRALHTRFFEESR